MEILCGWCVQCILTVCMCEEGDEKCKTVCFVKLSQFPTQLTCSLSLAENRLSSRSPPGVRSITWMAWGSPTSGSGGRRLTHTALFTASSWRNRPCTAANGTCAQLWGNRTQQTNARQCALEPIVHETSHTSSLCLSSLSLSLCRSLSSSSLFSPSFLFLSFSRSASRLSRNAWS